MCEICKAYKNFDHSVKIHKANQEKEHLYQSSFLVVNEYEKIFKQALANLAGKIMDDVVKESFTIIKDVKKSLVMDINELDRLSKIIDKNVLEFISKNISPDVLTDDQKDFLINSGVDPQTLTKEELTVFDIAFKFGMYRVGAQNANEINLHTFEQILKSNKFLPLDKKEQAALNSVKMEAGRYITGLGNKWNDQVQQILIESDKKQRAALETAIYDQSKEAIAKRKTVQQFASDLGHNTGLWARDLIRNAQYILHDAHEQGSAHEIERIYGEGSKVYKHVYPGACKHCIRLYLTGGIGSKPIIFDLNTLRGNGTNIRVKVADYKPVIGAVHPYCRCELVVIHSFQVWDDDKGKFVDKTRNVKDLKEEIRKKLEKRSGYDNT